MTNPPAKRKPGARPPGRPPKTSREQIVACAIAILEREPDAGISINRIARELKVAPMALYNYFTSRDELLQVVTEQMMAELEIPALSDASWRERIAGWAHAVRAHFQYYPHLIHLLTWEGHASVAWLKQSAPMIDALVDGGLRGDDLTRATLWLWSAIMGAIHNELSERVSERAISAEDLQRLDEPLRGRMRALQRFVTRKTHYDESFQYSLDRVLDALELVLSATADSASNNTPCPPSKRR